MWLKPWHTGTHLKVLNGNYPMTQTWQGLGGFQRSVQLCALDDSSLSIGRVKREIRVCGMWFKNGRSLTRSVGCDLSYAELELQSGVRYVMYKTTCCACHGGNVIAWFCIQGSPIEMLLNRKPRPDQGLSQDIETGQAQNMCGSPQILGMVLACRASGCLFGHPNP